MAIERWLRQIKGREFLQNAELRWFIQKQLHCAAPPSLNPPSKAICQSRKHLHSKRHSKMEVGKWKCHEHLAKGPEHELALINALDRYCFRIVSAKKFHLFRTEKRFSKTTEIFMRCSDSATISLITEIRLGKTEREIKWCAYLPLFWQMA